MTCTPERHLCDPCSLDEQPEDIALGALTALLEAWMRQCGALMLEEKRAKHGDWHLRTDR